MQKFWDVPELWLGRTAVILGGGPSLTKEQVEQVRGRAKVIAVNDAYLLCPWADLLYFCDDRWWSWHKDRPEYKAFAGIKVTLENPRVCQLELGVRSVKNYGEEGLCELRNGVQTGRNSGYQCINLAVHLGADPIGLLGFDMRFGDDGKSHWFGEHPIQAQKHVYKDVMLPCFKSIVKPLQQRKRTVINCTPGSALTVFPMATLEDFLGCLARSA